MPEWNEDFTALRNEAMGEANLREKEKQAAPRFAYFHCYCGMWHKFRRGRR